MSRLVLGIDIGGTTISFGLVSEKGDLTYENTIKTEDFPTPESLVEELYNTMLTNGFISKIIGIGIGAPNGNYYRGTIEYAPNLKWKGVVHLAKLFKNRFNTNAILTNDANAAALGELKFGNAKDLRNFVTITLGTGLGSGIIINGQLLYGSDGNAGEFGHIRVVPNGRSCGCGRKGCLETYASATGVVKSIRELESKHKSISHLNNLENPSSLDVFNLAENGDKFAEEIVEYTAKTLGSSLADFACFSNPEAYILFGGIAMAGKSFGNRVKHYLEEHILNIYKEKIEIRISSLHDKNAAVLGAASLIWNSHE